MDLPEVAKRSLLERMGLPTGAIRNIIMHRDIVPRAFACDYSLVADLLARVGEGFREHGCLQNPNGRQVRPVQFQLSAYWTLSHFCYFDMVSPHDRVMAVDKNVHQCEALTAMQCLQ